MNALHFSLGMQAREAMRYGPDRWHLFKGTLSTVEATLRAINVPTVHVATGLGQALPECSDGICLLKDTPAQTRDIISADPSLAIDMAVSSFSWVAYIPSTSACQQPSILRALAKRRVTTLLLSGADEATKVGEDLSLDGCAVSETAKDFAQRGYDVIIIAEGTPLGLVRAPTFLSLKQRQSLHAADGVWVERLEDVMAQLDTPLRAGITQPFLFNQFNS